MPTIVDLPRETLTDSIIPYLSLKEILNLSSCNKFLASTLSDDALWRRKLIQDFNFVASDAKPSGFKSLYKRLANPKVYVWGYVFF